MKEPRKYTTELRSHMPHLMYYLMYKKKTEYDGNDIIHDLKKFRVQCVEVIK